MRNNILKTLILAALLSSIFTASATEIFLQHVKGHNIYSDTPSNLIPAQSSVFDVRTQTVYSNTAAASEPESTLDKEGDKTMAENKKIEEQNKKLAEQNKKVEETNKKMRESACKTARMNRQMADSIRANNRDELINRYDQEVNNYCN